MKQVWNGRLINAEENDKLQKNGSFLYGDGFFETLRVEKGKILFSAYHYKRFVHTCEVLGIQNPFITENDFYTCVLLLAENDPSPYLRIRLHCWRDTEGAYFPNQQRVHSLVSSEPLEGSYTWNKQGLRMGFYDQHKKSTSLLSTIKSASAQLYVLAALDARQHSFDDAVIYNIHDRPVETTRSNLFIIKQGEIFTPPISEGCLDGVMRKVIIDLCIRSGIQMHEQPLGFAELMQADEIFTTNVIRGIQPVTTMDVKSISHYPVTCQIFHLLKEYLQD